MWGRIQLLSAVQGAALVANYALKDRFASLGICLAAILFTLYLNYIWEVDRLIRESYRERLALLGFKIGVYSEERELCRVHLMGIPIRARLDARISLILIFWAMIALDLVVLVVSVAVFKAS
jgi:hypothetical protein